jgi:hypothetical protein
MIHPPPMLIEKSVHDSEKNKRLIEIDNVKSAHALKKMSMCSVINIPSLYRIIHHISSNVDSPSLLGSGRGALKPNRNTDKDFKVNRNTEEAEHHLDHPTRDDPALTICQNGF